MSTVASWLQAAMAAAEARGRSAAAAAASGALGAGGGAPGVGGLEAPLAEWLGLVAACRTLRLQLLLAEGGAPPPAAPEQQLTAAVAASAVAWRDICEVALGAALGALAAASAPPWPAPAPAPMGICIPPSPAPSSAPAPVAAAATVAAAGRVRAAVAACRAVGVCEARVRVAAAPGGTDTVVAVCAGAPIGGVRDALIAARAGALAARGGASFAPVALSTEARGVHAALVAVWGGAEVAAACGCGGAFDGDGGVAECAALLSVALAGRGVGTPAPPPLAASLAPIAQWCEWVRAAGLIAFHRYSERFMLEPPLPLVRVGARPPHASVALAPAVRALRAACALAHDAGAPLRSRARGAELARTTLGALCGWADAVAAPGAATGDWDGGRPGSGWLRGVCRVAVLASDLDAAAEAVPAAGVGARGGDAARLDACAVGCACCAGGGAAAAAAVDAGLRAIAGARWLLFAGIAGVADVLVQRVAAVARRHAELVVPASDWRAPFELDATAAAAASGAPPPPPPLLPPLAPRRGSRRQAAVAPEPLAARESVGGGAGAGAAPSGGGAAAAAAGTAADATVLHVPVSAAMRALVSDVAAPVARIAAVLAPPAASTLLRALVSGLVDATCRGVLAAPRGRCGRGGVGAFGALRMQADWLWLELWLRLGCPLRSADGALPPLSPGALVPGLLADGYTAVLPPLPPDAAALTPMLRVRHIVALVFGRPARKRSEPSLRPGGPEDTALARAVAVGRRAAPGDAAAVDARRSTAHARAFEALAATEAAASRAARALLLLQDSPLVRGPRDG